MNKIRLYFFIVTLVNSFIYAQDPHFSQFNEHPSLINPALTGANDPLRASISYKNQWRSVTTSYQTYGASFESRLKSSNWQKVDQYRSMTFKERSVGRLAAGLSFYKDKAGDGNLSLTQANLSLATFVPTGKSSFLSCGLQASIVQRKLDNSKLIFPNQYNGLGYDATVLSGENFASQNIIYPDFAAGLLWSFNKSEKKLSGIKQRKANIGFSVYHLNKPSQKYLTTSKDLLSSKYVLHGDFLFDISNSSLAIAPTYLFQFQGATKELLAGLMFKYYLNNNSKYTGLVKRSSLNYGVYYRSNDAIIVNLMIEQREQYAIGLSYDINVSSLTSASMARGGMEITLRYTPPSGFLYQMKKKSTIDSGS